MESHVIFSVSHDLILFWIVLIKVRHASFYMKTCPAFPLNYHFELLFPQVSIEKPGTDHLIFFKMNTNVLVMILGPFVCQWVGIHVCFREQKEIPAVSLTVETVKELL